MNAYSLFARLGSGSTCDSRTDPSCLKLYAKDDLSIFANTGSPQADFFLAEVTGVHAGKTMEVSLFDPGEGGQSIQLLDPNGNPVSFTWRTLDGAYSGSGNSLDVSGTGGPAGRVSQSKLNERWVRLTTTLPANCASVYGTNAWWRIRYRFATTVTDRTTWKVSVIGDPVRLTPNA